jgi:predicted transcriptional regulator
MVTLTLRLPDELHEKLRWLAYSQRKSQHAILLEMVEKGLAPIAVPADAETEGKR